MKQNTSRSVRQLLRAHTNNHVDSSIVLSDLEFSGDGVGYVTLKILQPAPSHTTAPSGFDGKAHFFMCIPRWNAKCYIYHVVLGLAHLEEMYIYISLYIYIPYISCICTFLGRSLQYCANENATPDLHLDKENTSHQNPKFFLLNKHIELTQYTICGIVLSFKPFKNWVQ